LFQIIDTELFKVYLIGKNFSLIFVYTEFKEFDKMKTSRDKGKPLHFEVSKSKQQMRKEIALRLTPEERLQKLTEMINFNKKFNNNYYKALQKRLKEGNAFILE